MLSAQDTQLEELSPKELHHLVRTLKHLTIVDLRDIGIEISKREFVTLLRLCGPGDLREVAADLDITYWTAHWYSKKYRKAFKVQNRDELKALLVPYLAKTSPDDVEVMDQQLLRMNRELKERNAELAAENVRLHRQVQVLLAKRGRP